MSESEQFTIGSEVVSDDGPCGKLTRAVVDPVARSLTHLVAEPREGDRTPRLVGVNLVESADDTIRLRCTTSQLAALEEAVDTEFLPAATEDYGYGEGHTLQRPYFGLGVGRRVDMGNDEDVGPRTVTYDRVPLGEVEVRRGDPVHATDGHIGSVKGLAVDPADHQVTHVLLEEGHFWGHKEVAIPIGATARIDDEIRVDMTKEQIEQLSSR